jgi:hypothetical protein
MAGSKQVKKVLAKLRAYPIALIAGFCVVAFSAVIFLRSSSLAAFESELETREGEWQRMNSNLMRARDLAIHLARIQEIQETVNRRLMDPEERAINYDYFYSLEERSGVRLVSLNQSGVIATKNATLAGIEEFKEYQIIGYAVSIEGTFDQVVHFLTTLINGEHFARLSGFTVSHAQKSAMGALSVNLQMQVLGVPRED